MDKRMRIHDHSMLASMPPFTGMMERIQAMNRPDIHLFIEAMETKMDQMMLLGAWELIDEKDAPFTESG
eukprot:15346558-Ditylum_brightwellii.AAC.1